MSSGSLKDTYVFDPNDKIVRLVESVNLEKLQKQEKMREILGNLEGKPLDEVVRGFGRIVVEKYKSPGTAQPRVLKTAVDEEQEIGVVALGIYSSGYDPAITTIELYVVRPDGSFQKLKDVDLESYERPKFSSTFFKVRDIKISEGKVELTGAVMQEYWAGLNMACRELDRMTRKRRIGKKYRKLEEVLQ